MAQDPYKYFRIEARELAEQLARHVLDLEKEGPPAPIVARLLRIAHTLKGAARVVKQPEIADAAHAIEDVLAPHREGLSAVPRNDVNAILGLVDRIADRTAALTPANDEKAATPGRSVPAAGEAFNTVRADVAEMDGLLDGMAEIHTQLAGIRQAAQTLVRTRELANFVSDQVAAPRRQADAQATAAVALARIAPIAEELRELIGGLERKFAIGIDQVDREVRQTRDAAERMRLLPAGAVSGSLERTARDAAQALGKRVAFAMSGSEVRLDAQVLGVLQGALVQLVRNAVAHGIETEAERKAAGKPGEGRIRVEVARRGERVVFACHDDGRGLDVDAIRASARRKGLLAADVQGLGAEQLFQLLLKGGISTSSSVTEVSGRGVGLDVVREAAERLGGTVRIETQARAKTVVEIAVPVSLSSLDALIVEAAGVRVAIPLDDVQLALRIGPHDVAHTPAGKTVIHEGKAIPLVELAQYLSASHSPSAESVARSAVVLEVDGTLTAVGVDRLVGAHNVVLRALPKLAPVDPIVAGASLDGEGNPQIVLDARGLSARARSTGPAAATRPTRRLPILVIDDSPTTRMLEQSILEAAGYEAHVATSAEDALVKVREHTYGLFLVDVEMPGMDGFAFVARTRADPELRKIPAILVTSRNEPEDRKRGEEAGAYGYIVKSEFNQVDLLERIRKVVG
ncbi:MAG: response regulator [Betaproteobacteria bacterium]